LQLLFLRLIVRRGRLRRRLRRVRLVTADRVGVLWRHELAGDVFANLDRLDVVEVIAEDWLDLPASRQAALRTLAAQVPVTLHGVSMGLASAAPVEPARLDRMARLCDRVEPLHWSEHLAFVRGGGIEIGHLAAPPRTAETVETTARNLLAARRVVGRPPLVENVATLLEPPGSDRAESIWISQILAASGAGLLLDLHNLHANAVNFGFDDRAGLFALPLDRVREIHIAGGRWIGADSPRLLDDHRHDVPDTVFALLEDTAAHAHGPLVVILERDGNHPAFARTLDELERARVALQRGRQRRLHEHRL
jgi:hypothetical protein